MARSGGLTDKESLEGLGELRIQEGGVSPGCTLFGAAASLRETIGAPCWPADHRDVTVALDEARLRLGDAKFSADWTRGRNLSTDEALSFAEA